MVSSVVQSDITLVRAQKQNPTVLPPKEAIEFALRLFELFGQRYAKATVRPLVKDKASFDQVHRALVEVQTRLESGKTTFVDITCPQTAAVLVKCGEAQNLLAMFERVKMFSYSLLPFLQKVILHYSQPEMGTLERLEAVRRRGFTLMVELLKREQLPENKGDQDPMTLTPEQEYSISRLYFRGGALVYGRVIYFSEMVHMWGAIAAPNQQIVEGFKKRLSFREWVDDNTTPVPIFLTFVPSDRSEEWSFPKYLAYCSVLSIERNLGLKFPRTVFARLGERFMDEESVRADLSYFSATPRLFYELDIAPFQRSSAYLVRAFQIFFFFTRNVDLPEDQHGALLSMLVYRDPTLRVEAIPGFAARQWVQNPWSPDDIGAFKEAWEGLQEILSCTVRRDVSFAHPSPEDEALFASPEPWGLFLILWKSPQRTALIDLIKGLKELPRFTMTPKSVLAFFQYGGNGITQPIEVLFLEAYKETLKALEEKGIEIQHTESIFFDPPEQFWLGTVYGFARPRTLSFVDRMQPYHFDDEAQYCFMLRTYIRYPQVHIIDLLGDCGAFGTEATNALVYESLSKVHPGFEPELVPSVQTREKASALAKAIQDEHHLPPKLIFSIYMELVRLVMNGQEACMDQVKEAVRALAELCPSISDETVWFMLRYRPENLTADRIAKIASKREEWVENNDERQRFVVDQNWYQERMQDIEDFGTNAKKACPDDHTADHFSLTCQMDLLAAFFPYLQPLSNFFHITHLTVAGGIRWGEPVWKTHEGQLKLLKHSNVGIYLHWSVIKSRPVLFMSFFNVRTGRAVSSFIPLQILTAVIEPLRGSFYGLLSSLAQQVLKEGAHGDVPSDAPETPESWAPAYVGVKETIANFPDVAEHVPRMWDFLQNVKLRYRNFYLDAITESELPVALDVDLWRVAASGHIFASHPRGALVSQLPEEHPEYYIPDATEAFVSGCRNLFAQPTQKAELLNLDLKTMDGSIPVSYHVQTTEQFVGAAFGDRENEKAAPPEERGGKYITLSANGVKIPLRYPPAAFENGALFQRYFDYHNLLLKAAYYFTRSLE